MTNFRLHSACGAGLRALRSIAYAAVILAGSAVGLAQTAAARSQTDGTQPLVSALSGYVNPWVHPYVNLYSGSLLVRQILPDGKRCSAPYPVLDPAADLAFGSSPAARSLTGPAEQAQAQSRIPVLHELHLALTYGATIASADSTLGIAGWRHSYLIKLTCGGAIDVVTWGDGRQDQYARAIVGADTSWVGHASLEAAHIHRIGASYVLSARHGGAYVFDLDGRLIAIRDRTLAEASVQWSGNRIVQVSLPSLGASLQFSYDGSGRLTTVLDGVRTQHTTFQYDGSGRLSAVTDPTGAVVQYQYDTSNRLATIVEQDGDALSITYYPGLSVVRQVTMGSAVRTFSFDGATRTTIVYDLLAGSAASQVAYTFDAHGLCTGVADNGDIFSSVYDPTTWRRTQFVNAHGDAVTARYDLLGNLTSVADTYGNCDSLLLEPVFHLAAQLRGPTGTTLDITRNAYGSPTQVTDVLGNTGRFVWAGGGSPSGIEQLATAIGFRGDSTRYTYGLDGNVTVAVDPAGVSHEFDYDSHGRLARVWDERGNGFFTDITYDERDAVTWSTDHATNTWLANGRLQKTVAPSGATVRYEYDALNRPIRIEDPLGRATQVTRDGAGRVTRRTDPLGHATDRTYDAQGHVLTTCDPAGEIYTSEWDGPDLLSTTDPVGQTVTFGYDARGLLASRSSSGVSTTYSYDNAARLLNASAADVDTVVTHNYTYDLAGRLVGHSQSGIGLDTHYDLDDGGLPVRLWDTGQADSIRYTYDKRGLPTTLVASIDGYPFTAQLVRDELGGMTHVAYTNGVTSSFSYDTLGRTSSIAHTGTGWNAFYHLNYDPDGRIAAVDASHPGLGPVLLELERDGDARITGEQLTPGRDFTYGYDLAGRRATKTAPYGSDVYSWAVDDRLTSAGASSLSWDAAGRCTLLVLPPDTLHVTYRSDGALQSIKRNGPTGGGALSGTWRAMHGPFGELAGWVLPDGRRFWMGQDGGGAGLLRRSTSALYSGVQDWDDYVYAPGSGRLPLIWSFGGGPEPPANRFRSVLRGPLGSVAEVTRAVDAQLGFRRFHGPFGEYADTSAGTWRPLQAFGGLEIIPGDNLRAGIPDSVLLVNPRTGDLYAPRLGIRLVRPTPRGSVSFFGVYPTDYEGASRGTGPDGPFVQWGVYPVDYEGASIFNRGDDPEDPTIQWGVYPTEFEGASICNRGDDPEDPTIQWGVYPTEFEGASICNRSVDPSGASYGEPEEIEWDFGGIANLGPGRPYGHPWWWYITHPFPRPPKPKGDGLGGASR